MRCQVFLAAAFACVLTLPVRAQTAEGASKNAPIYQVNVIERTVRAVNYRYRNGPTKIDFKGTVLLPEAKGEATVESKAGRTQIDARLEHLTSPQKFGAGYLTYVLWAISPEGHAKNLGELIPGSSDKASLDVTTDLQAFGLIVTAEPYSAVRQPGNVVVAENQIRLDTIGASEPIEANYELLPRGQYTYTLPEQAQAPGGPKVSMGRYESTLELYQAQNAVQIARSLGADKYAPEVMQKATLELTGAQELSARKAKSAAVVTAAREAEETAEDARLIALDRQHTEAQAAATERAAAQSAALQQAQAEARAAQAQQQADHQLLEQEHAALLRAQAEAAAKAAPAPPPPPPVAAEGRADPSPLVTTPEKKDLRALMLRQLDESLPTLDTPRGLAITVPEADFSGAAVKPSIDPALARVASILTLHPGLRVDVEGHTDNALEGAQERLSHERAMAVRDALVDNGVPANSVAVRDAGAGNPVASNGAAAGRVENRRVEIVVSGDPIGAMATWDNSYSIMPGR